MSPWPGRRPCGPQDRQAAVDEGTRLAPPWGLCLSSTLSPPRSVTRIFSSCLSGEDGTSLWVPGLQLLPWRPCIPYPGQGWGMRLPGTPVGLLLP